MSFISAFFRLMIIKAILVHVIPFILTVALVILRLLIPIVGLIFLFIVIRALFRALAGSQPTEM